MRTLQCFTRNHTIQCIPLSFEETNRSPRFCYMPSLWYASPGCVNEKALLENGDSHHLYVVEATALILGRSPSPCLTSFVTLILIRVLKLRLRYSGIYWTNSLTISTSQYYMPTNNSNISYWSTSVPLTFLLSVFNYVVSSMDYLRQCSWFVFFQVRN